VLWNTARSGRLFAALQADQPVSGQRISGPGPGGVPRAQPPRLRPGQVAVDVYNGTLIGGLSASTGAALARLGFRVHAGLNWSAHDIAHSLIEFPPGQRAGARLVRTALPGAALSQLKGLPRIRIVLGASGYSVAHREAAHATAASAGARRAARAAGAACQ
jgi:hypothetical protein